MSPHTDPHRIRTVDALDALVGEVGAASIRKEVPYLHPIYQAWIAASPFAVLATVGPDGLDASPRGDPPGWAICADEHTLLLPERRGNQRVDSLRNLLTDPRVALLFMIPGVGETLRVNGRAAISVAPELLQRCTLHGKPPVCVLRVAVDSAFFQCARAMQRSGLWEPRDAASRPAVPSAGAMLAALTGHELGGASYDRELPERQRRTLY